MSDDLINVKNAITFFLPETHVYELATKVLDFPNERLRSMSNAFLDWSNQANKLLHLSRAGEKSTLRLYSASGATKRWSLQNVYDDDAKQIARR